MWIRRSGILLLPQVADPWSLQCRESPRVVWRRQTSSGPAGSPSVCSGTTSVSKYTYHIHFPESIDGNGVEGAYLGACLHNRKLKHKYPVNICCAQYCYSWACGVYTLAGGCLHSFKWCSSLPQTYGLTIQNISYLSKLPRRMWELVKALCLWLVSPPK